MRTNHSQTPAGFPRTPENRFSLLNRCQSLLTTEPPTNWRPTSRCRSSLAFPRRCPCQSRRDGTRKGWGRWWDGSSETRSPPEHYRRRERVWPNVPTTAHLYVGNRKNGGPVEKKGTAFWPGWPTQRPPYAYSRCPHESPTRSRSPWAAESHVTSASRLVAFVSIISYRSRTPIYTDRSTCIHR